MRRMATKRDKHAITTIQACRRENRSAPWVVTRPILDALLGSFIMAGFLGAMIYLWIKAGAGL